MITIFTPSFADEADTNAQNLSVKEIVVRLDPERAAVKMLYEGVPDPRIASRPNTTLLRWREHGNTLRTAWQILKKVPDVYFFPREGPLDAVFLGLRRYLRLKTAVVTYIVSGGLHSQSYPAARIRNIREADSVIANNNYLAQLLKERLDIDAETIYDGVDRRYYFRLSRGERRVIRLPSCLLDLCDLISEHPWSSNRQHVGRKYSFVLPESERKNKSARIWQQNSAVGTLSFSGICRSSSSATEMRRADIFFFPSILEGHPQVLLQAAASGLPAIAMDGLSTRQRYQWHDRLFVGSDAELSEKLDWLIQPAGADGERWATPRLLTRRNSIGMSSRNSGRNRSRRP